MTLRTERLELRPFAAGDFDAMLAMQSDVGVVRYLYEWVKGEWQSELVYALLDREWRAAQA